MKFKKGWGLVAAGAAAVLLLGAAALLLLRAPAETDEAGSLVIRAGDLSQLSRIAIENEHGENGALTVTALDGGFEIEGIPSILVDYTRFSNLVNSAAALKARRLVDPKPQDLALYGLGRPAARVEISYSGGEALRLVIGAAEAVSGGRYFMAEGRDAVYLMDEAAALGFVQPRDYFIERRATPPLKLTTPLSAVRDVTFAGAAFPGGSLRLLAVSGGGGEVRRQALSFGAPTHLVVRGDDTFEMDQTYGIEVLGSLLGVEAVAIEAVSPSPQQMADYGFNAPLLTVDFGLANEAGGAEEHYTLRVAEKDGKTLLAVNGRDAVYELSADLPFLNVDPSRLMMRWYISPLLMDVAEVEITAPEVSLLFTLSGAGTQMQAAREGEAVDIERFRDFFTLLISAAHDGGTFENDAWQNGQPLLTLCYRYADEHKAPDVLRFYAAGTRRVGVSVNGNPVEFGIRENYVARVLAACAAMQDGGAFDVNW